MKLALALSLLLLTSCAPQYRSRNPLKRAFQFAYCNKMENGKCVAWATPCGKMRCE